MVHVEHYIKEKNRDLCSVKAVVQDLVLKYLEAGRRRMSFVSGDCGI